MFVNALIESNGKRYATTKAFAELWDVSAKTVSDYCKDEKIPGAIKISRNMWYIPTDAIKPIDTNVISKMLFSVLQIKNNPNADIDFSGMNTENVNVLLKNLSDLKYIKNFSYIENLSNEEICNNIVLTNRGMKFLTSHKVSKKFDWKQFLLEKLPLCLKLGIEVYKIIK